MYNSVDHAQSFNFYENPLIGWILYIFPFAFWHFSFYLACYFDQMTEYLTYYLDLTPIITAYIRYLPPIGF